jgi:hypothetical protein
MIAHEDLERQSGGAAGGSAALSRYATAHPLHTGFANTFGCLFF